MFSSRPSERSLVTGSTTSCSRIRGGGTIG
jgi:hypothetical protein